MRGPLAVIGLIAALHPVAASAGVPPPDPVAASAGVPPPDPVTVDTLKINGTGCRADTTAVGMSPGNRAFTVTFSAYQAVAGAGAKPGDGRRSCSITVRLNVPADVAYAVAQVDHRGFTHLEAGATAVQTARYKFQNQGPHTRTEHAFAGPTSDGWNVTDVSTDPVFGPCGKGAKLDIDTELSVDPGPPGATAPLSMIVMDSTDGFVSASYRLVWRRCAGL